MQSTYIRAPTLLAMSDLTPAWASFSLNRVRSGNVYAIDGRETGWSITISSRVNTSLSRSTATGRCGRSSVSTPISHTSSRKEDWIGRRLIADKFREGRVFICGDAAHLWVPMRATA